VSYQYRLKNLLWKHLIILGHETKERFLTPKRAQANQLKIIENTPEEDISEHREEEDDEYQENKEDYHACTRRC
jgi:virulence-associated protein VagC